MAFQTPDSHVPDSVGLSTQSCTSTQEVHFDQSLMQRTDAERTDGASGRSGYWPCTALLVAMTVAALMIGSFKGGWPYACILGAIVLGEGLAVIAHHRKVTNA